MDKIKATIPLVESSLDSQGTGEGIKYQGVMYYYRTGKKIPKNRAVALRWEGNFFGKVRGELRHIIVAWNDKNFIVLESVSEKISKVKQKYRGLSTEEAIFLAVAYNKKIKAKLDAIPKCNLCGKIVLLLEKDQPGDKCLPCFKEVKLNEKIK